jgi:hypothetical protein
MKVDLLEMLAGICCHAQDNICDPEFYETDLDTRERCFQQTSYVIACFLSQYTFDGHMGVESEIVLEQLADNTLNENGYMFKSTEQWKDIINSIANKLGGFKK